LSSCTATPTAPTHGANRWRCWPVAASGRSPSTCPASGPRAAFTYHHRRRARIAHYLDTAHRLIPELRQPLALERISTPVLLIWGDRDRMVFHGGAEKVLEAVPDSRLELRAGVGHCPQVEDAERFGAVARLRLRARRGGLTIGVIAPVSRP
jgi:pimeloyl-ACP methyl ester carboxylesterase